MYQTTDITIIIAHKPINRSCFKSATVSFGRGTPSHVLPCVFNTHPAMILSTLWIDVLFPSYIHQLSKLLLVHFRKEVFQCIYKHICIKQFFYQIQKQLFHLLQIQMHQHPNTRTNLHPTLTVFPRITFESRVNSFPV